MSSPRGARPWLALILLLYLFLGAGMSLVVPLAEAPDELDHYLYGRYLARERAFPPLSPVAAENPTMEANQPPLFYAVQAAATGWIGHGEALELAQNNCFSFDPDDAGRQTFYVHTFAEAAPFAGPALAFRAGRLLSVLLGALAVVLAYALGRLAAPGDARVGLLAAALLAFNPQFLFISASVNNDVLTAVLGVAIVTLSALAWERPRPATFALLDTVVGLGLLTKAGLFAVWPVALLAAAAPLARLPFAPRGTERPWRAALRSSLLPLALVGGIPLLLAGWWYVRATRLYGDPLAWRVHLAAKGPFVLREGRFGLQDLGEFVDLHFRSAWALFGWLNVAVPGWVYAVLALLVIAAAAGLLWAVAACLRRGEPCTLSLPTLGLSALAVLATYVSLLRYVQTINWSGYQGRLAFAAAAPVAVLLAAGLSFLAGRAETTHPPRSWLARLLRWLPPGFLLVLSAAALLLVLPAAYPRQGIFQIAGLSPACARFAPGLLLDGFQAPLRAAPGERVAVTLATYGMAGQSGEGVLTVELRGDGGELWGTGETAVSWQPGQTVTTSVPLAVDGEAAPGRATLFAGLRGAGGNWAAGRSANGRDLPQPLALDTLKIPAPAVTATPQTAVGVDLEGTLRLEGYDLAREDGDLAVTLYWSALGAPAAEHTTYVHLLDADGRLLAQDDGQPGGGKYPTSIWDTGEVVLDRKLLALPAPLPPGPLRLVAGAYLLPEGASLGEEVPLQTVTFSAEGELRP